MKKLVNQIDDNQIVMNNFLRTFFLSIFTWLAWLYLIIGEFALPSRRGI